MLSKKNYKRVKINTDFTVDNAAFTTTEIDTKGYDTVCIVVELGNVPANIASMTITESDTAGSGHAAFFTVGTTTDLDGNGITLPTAAGGDGDTLEFWIDMRNGRKRYLDLTCTAGDGTGTATEMCAYAVLMNAEMSVETDTERGVTQSVRL